MAYEITKSLPSTTLPAGKTLTITAPAGSTVRVWEMGTDGRIRPQDKNASYADVNSAAARSWGPYRETRYFGFTVLAGSGGSYTIELQQNVAASDVRIADANGNFTGATVEAALAELAARLDALEA